MQPESEVEDHRKAPAEAVGVHVGVAPWCERSLKMWHLRCGQMVREGGEHQKAALRIKLFQEELEER